MRLKRERGSLRVVRMMEVGIVGASGYSGEVLVELLAGHPQVRLNLVTSRSLEGRLLGEVFPRIGHRLGGLTFSASQPEAVADSPAELIFLALPHGVAAGFAGPLRAAGKTVIDLSADFRLGSVARYEEFYGKAHPAPGLLEEAVYVLPEWAAPGWEKRDLLAAPGCYPTSVLLPLLPLLGSGLHRGQGIVANCLSGVSGAGKQASEDFSFCERAGSMRSYGLPKHRHLSEIEEQLSLARGADVAISFHPHLIPVRRGILSTISLPLDDLSLPEVYRLWREAYEGRPFIRVLPTGQFPDTKWVVGTNCIDFSAVADERCGRLIITAAEDNLLKGASGQAVQIMNLRLGLPETTGLP